MKQAKALSAALLSAALCASLLAGCGQPASSTPAAPASGTPESGTASQTEAEWATVRVGIHSNGPGSALFATALEKGYFDEEHIKVEYNIVAGGGVEMAAMRADNRTLDVGFIGAGVAWNAMDAAGNQLSFVFTDSWSNNENFIAAPEVGLTAESSWQELYEALKGQTVYVDTSTTPGNWMKEFVSRCNLKGGAGDTEVPDDQKLWIDCESSNFMEGYQNPNPSKDPTCKVTFFNMSNETIPAAYQSGDARLVCCYSPSTKTCIKCGGVKVATAGTHMPDFTYINTWVASQKWIQEEPDVVQRFVNALVKAEDYRAKNLQDASTMAEKVIEVEAGSIDPDDCVVFTAQELADGMEGFAEGKGTLYGMMELLYNDKKSHVESGQVKSLQDSCEFSYMQNAVDAYLGK